MPKLLGLCPDGCLQPILAPVTAGAKVQKEVLYMSKMNYEFVLVIDSSIGEEAIAGVVEKYKTLIGNNGELVSVDEWGNRRLAYTINFKNEGYYVVFNYATENPEFSAELERISKIAENILRWLVIRKA